MIHSRRMQKGWNLVFVAVIAAVLFIGIAAVHRLNALADATEGVERSLAGLRTLDQTLAAMIDMESGARGYLLTANEEYLDPYRDGAAAINGLLDELDAALGADPLQRPRLAALRAGVDARVRHLESLIVSVDIAAAPGPYMRQDKRFKDGEAISSVHFARLLSRSFDGLITVDPHLHRRRDLGEIFTIATRVEHASVGTDPQGGRPCGALESGRLRHRVDGGHPVAVCPGT